MQAQSTAPFHPELLAQPVPRYTSYPTAVEFGPCADPDAYEAQLQDVSGDISLYVHIPFCDRISWYCGCNTGAAGKALRLESYLEALDREIGLVANAVAARATVRRISFGGGSPNALQPLAFVRLVDRLLTAFGAHTPLLSIELDPRTLTAEWARTLGTTKVQNASLGVQTLDPRVQAAIGRVQPEQDVRTAVDQLRDAGIASLNFDLMYGLPQQDQSSVLETLDRAAAMGPDRISFFGYAHVPERIPRQRQIDATGLADAPARFAMASGGHDALVRHGYEAVGFDHFARPADPLACAARRGELRRNFQGFTDDNAETVIGLGASAISLFSGHIFQNDSNSGRYRMLLSQGRHATHKWVQRTRADRERALVIEDILCGRDADLSGLGGGRPFRMLLQPFLDKDLVLLEGDMLRTRAAAWPYWRAIAACFDGYRHLGRRFSSSAV